MADITRWSLDPASNDLSDPACPWPEGMGPAQVNDSARGMMAAIAGFVGDTGFRNTGVLDGRTYRVTTQSGIETLDRPFVLTLVLNASNPGPVKLSVNGLAAKDIARPRGIALAPGDLPSIEPVVLAWNPAFGSFRVLSPWIERPGIYRPQAHSNLEDGWLWASGQAVSRTDYAALFAQIGVFYGAGDGSTTFNLPDLNGRTMVAADAQNDTPRGRLTGVGGVGSGLGAFGGSEAAALTAGQMPKHAHDGTTGDGGGQGATSTGSAGGHNHGGNTGSVGDHTHTGSTGDAGSHSHGGTTASGGEHAHTMPFRNQTSYGPGSLAATNAMGIEDPVPTATATTNTGGLHSHTFTTDTAPAHSHSVTTNGAGGHSHTVSVDGAHSHIVPAVAAHSHAFTTSEAGNSEAVSRMQPSFVVLIAIKA
ncbi:phage tail protein [uncultured Methylobacterium sp.]|jgi:microcystin-dependent protein|uniref:phage tail protein n=1 Tax=uncultured Methylobacterium sp. TaxID=157278 RepID=UPI0026116E80|nr:phage tail protein [uncultured Methylobacterium sp.]